MESSTIRSAAEQTIGEVPATSPATLRDVISVEWRQSGQVDLVSALRRHPPLLRDRSLLLNLAIEEYQAKRRHQLSVDLEGHCQRFHEFGRSVQLSILRQLEAQRYIDDHPEFLEALCSPDWPDLDEKFGSFHVLEELGRGASSRAYLCAQNDVGDRRVVVKASPVPSVEASILGRLEHPNIIPILSTGYLDDRGLYYVCMPFRGRSTLTDVIDMAFEDGCPRTEEVISLAATRWNTHSELAEKHHRRSVAAVIGQTSYVDGTLTIALQIADALHWAHSRQILHGDLKPSNVLLTPHARALLLDFNLSQDFTKSPSVGGGTLPYMPPEHLRLVAQQGQQQDQQVFDARTDIYSFGAVLYELLTGKAPIALPSETEDIAVLAHQLLTQVRNGPPPIRMQNPLVSRRLESLIAKCLAFDASQRPTSMAEVCRLLEADKGALAKAFRVARIRPLFFSLSLAIPLALVGATATYIAKQPAKEIKDYEQGLALSAAGDLDAAADHFVSAIRSNPHFIAARFELARTRIAQREFDAALSAFAELAMEHHDAESMAYLGYCFNLKETSSAAIPWHERAIEHGAKVAPVYNNLGASYLDGRSQSTRLDQLRSAEECLLKALELDGNATTVHLNLVRLATARAAIDSNYRPVVAWQHAQRALQDAPNRAAVQFHVASWYRTVLLRENQMSKESQTSGKLPEAARLLFENTHHQAFKRQQQQVAGRDNSSKSDATLQPAIQQDYYLEPIAKQ